MPTPKVATDISEYKVNYLNSPIQEEEVRQQPIIVWASIELILYIFFDYK